MPVCAHCGGEASPRLDAGIEILAAVGAYRTESFVTGLEIISMESVVAEWSLLSGPNCGRDLGRGTGEGRNQLIPGIQRQTGYGGRSAARGFEGAVDGA